MLNLIQKILSLAETPIETITRLERSSILFSAYIELEQCKLRQWANKYECIPLSIQFNPSWHRIICIGSKRCLYQEQTWLLIWISFLELTGWFQSFCIYGFGMRFWADFLNFACFYSWACQNMKNMTPQLNTEVNIASEEKCLGNPKETLEIWEASK